MSKKDYSFTVPGTYKIDSSDANIVCENDGLFNIDFISENEDNNLQIIAKNNSIINLRIFNNASKKLYNLNAKVCKNSIFNIFMADFSNQELVFNSVVDLDEENASSSIKFASLSANDKKKKYKINFNHNTPKTKSLLEGFGVCEKASSIVVNGISHIKENSIKSNAAQKIKVILFDEESAATANPILKIDCDDIVASHACAIGNLNQDHIFYLLTRGIEEKEARKLITTGYLSPISEYFDGTQKEEIQNLIEGNL